MLQSVEVLPGARRAMRRAVSTETEILCDYWDELVCQPVGDLSSFGLFLETAYPLEKGADVLLSFVPPGWQGDREIEVFGRVARSVLARRHGDHGAGMGIEFLDLDPHTARDLERCLRGLPPPLPSASLRRSPETDLVWIDMPVVYEERFEDRFNLFEVSELIGTVADDELHPRALGSLVTGGRPPYAWLH